MQRVGIKALKNDLSRYVKLARAGETVQITDRDTVVAELVPPARRTGPRSQAEIIEDLVRRGVMTPAKDRNAPLPEPLGIMTMEELMAGLDEDRADRF